MNYSIQELEEFLIIGQEIELTNSQRRNSQICRHFWRKFNSILKKSYLTQSSNWVKFAFMERREGELFYFCSIPKKAVVPDGFMLKAIKPHKYLVVEHVGSMDKICDAYKRIYQEILPNSNQVLSQNDFLHFEKYDYRFHWNRENSIIEIWIPIQG